MTVFAQINIKVPVEVKREFDECLKTRRESCREVIEHMITAYCCATINRSVLHLDGQLCPLNQMIKDLASATIKQIEGTTETRAEVKQ